MKRILSLILVATTIIGVGGFSAVSSSFAASAEGIENDSVLIVEANAQAISPMEISEEIAPSEVPEVSVEETEPTENVPVVETEESESPVEAVSEKSKPEAKIIIDDISEYIDFVDYEAIIFVIDELFYQVWEMDADASAFVVQYGDEYYFVVNWDVHDGNGFVKLNHEVHEDEEFFFCDGDEFRTMIIRSLLTGDKMFEA